MHIAVVGQVSASMIASILHRPGSSTAGPVTRPPLLYRQLSSTFVLQMMACQTPTQNNAHRSMQCSGLNPNLRYLTSCTSAGTALGSVLVVALLALLTSCVAPPLMAQPESAASCRLDAGLLPPAVPLLLADGDDASFPDDAMVFHFSNSWSGISKGL